MASMTGWAIIILYTHLYAPSQLPTMYVDKETCEIAKANTEKIMKRKGVRGTVICAQVVVPAPSVTIK